MTPLEKEILAQVTPTPEEEAAAARTVADLEAEATRALAAAGLPGAAAVQGSLAKGTWLKGGADIDLFLLLDPTVPATELESVAERIGRRILERPQKKYAQHPYLQGFFRGQAVDLVPAYRVASAHAKMSAVDRTPFHTAWVRGRLDAKGRGEVRLAKRWMEGVGVYGAETAIGGFSGYLVEVLVAHLGSFAAVVEWFRGGAKPRRIALGPDEAKDDVAPLVVVDPVDPGRNCAAAVTPATLERAIAAATAFHARPDRRFFFPAPPRAEPAAALQDALRRQDASWAGVLLRPRTDRLDIVLPQFQRGARTLEAALRDAGFPPLRLDVAERGGSEVLLQFVTKGGEIPARRRHRGPVDDARSNAARFREKWSGHPDATGPVRRGADGHLEVELRVLHRTPAAWLAARLREVALGKHVEEALPDAKVLAAPGDAPEAWRAAVSEFVLDRRPWER